MTLLSFSNFVPRVSHLIAPGGGKKRDPGNEVGITTKTAESVNEMAAIPDGSLHVWLQCAGLKRRIWHLVQRMWTILADFGVDFFAKDYLFQ